MVMPTLPRGFRVYKATNKLNGHFYIGMTGQLLRQRVKGHKKGSEIRGNMRFTDAIAKYGFDNFVFDELYLFDNKQDAWDMEIMMISDLNPHYNVDMGGPGSRGNLGKPQSDETKRKGSESRKAVWAKSRNQNSLDALNFGRERYAREVGSKPVRLINDGRIFASGKAAAKALGISGGSVSECANGKRDNIGGLMFEFVKKGATGGF
jgi:predicted GIY-YIG superfamily endonuclease